MCQRPQLHFYAERSPTLGGCAWVLVSISMELAQIFGVVHAQSARSPLGLAYNLEHLNSTTEHVLHGEKIAALQRLSRLIGTSPADGTTNSY